MTRKRMVAVRLDEQLADRIDRLAEAEGVTRTEWCAQALARHALTVAGTSSLRNVSTPADVARNELRVAIVGSAHPQPGDEPGDGAA